MNEPLLTEFFLEDNGHRQLVVPLAERVAKEEGIRLRSRIRNAAGGHVRAMKSFEHYQTLRSKGIGGGDSPDVLVVAIDGNCSSFTAKRDEIRSLARPDLFHALVAACPDPHIERWYMADPRAFKKVVGSTPHVGAAKCLRDHYKRLLADAVRSAGHTPTLGGVEFGADLAAEMDLFHAGKSDASFKAFVGDLREALRGASRAAR